MAVSAPLLVILAVQAVPTVLFTSFSPLLFIGSLPFSLLFVTLSVLISVCSCCWTLAFSVDENDAPKCSHSSRLFIDCTRVSSKLSNRSWWSCGEGPRGFQLAMLFLTWALLFLLLCLPPMVNAEINTERLVSLGDGPETDSSFNGAIREVTSKETNEGETGPERRQDVVNNGPLPTTAIEQSSFDSSGSSDQTSAGAHSPAKVELQSCRALVRAGTRVTCGAPAASEVGESSDVRDCSKETLVEKLSSVSAAEALFSPSHLQFGMQPLYQRQVAFLTIMNSCNGSRLSLLAAKSDNRQFLVTGFSEKLVAPGGTLTFPVCYLPQYIGAAKGSLTIETGVDKLVVQLQGEGVESLFKINVRVQPGKSHFYVLSLFNPCNETLFVEEVVVLPENEGEFKPETKSDGIKTKLDRVSELDDIVIKAEEGSSSHRHELLMRAGETWDLPAQTMTDIVDFNILLDAEEMVQGAFQIRVVGPALEDKGVTLVYPFSSRVSRPSPVMSIPDMLDFGMLVGDQASSQPLILQNSGEQLVKVEEIYEDPGDPRIAIDYEKGRILRPGLETEVANITFSGQNQPHESSACRRMQKIVVRTNSTIGHLIEIAYRAIVLQCLDSSSPAMAFVTGSTGRTVGELGGSHRGQGITDLLMDYKLLMVLLFCGVVVSLLVFFQVVVHDTDLPTISGDLGKGGCHRRSNSRVTPFIKRRDKLLKMWGWGALATVVDGVWAAFGSTLWSKDCSTSNNPDYSLPRSVTPAAAAAQAAPAQTATTASSKSSAGASASVTPQAGGRKGSSDRKGSGAAKADHTRRNAETGLPVTTRDSSHHPPSVKQPKASKFLRSEHTKHSSLMESSVDADAVVVKHTPVAAAPPPEIETIAAPAQSAGPPPNSCGKESPKNTTFSSVAQKTQPASPRAPPPVVERERRRRKKKSGRYDVAANLGTTSPASPASPVTPSAAAWPASPLSPEKKSDQSTASLSPRSSGSVDLVDAAPLPKLKVKVLHSPKAPNPAPVVESPRRNVVAATPLQPRQQGKAVADHRKQQPSGVNKRSNFSEWAAIARKKTPSTGYSSKESVVADGSQSYRTSRSSRDAYVVAEDGPGACFKTSASFPRLNARQGWVNPLREFGVDSFDTSVVPPPAIAPALRAPGAKITKQAAAIETGWTSLGFTANPEFHLDRDLLPGAPWHAGSLSGQSSGELVYDIWGNHFGNLSQCSESSAQLGFEKEVDGLHKLLVPEHLISHHSEGLFAGTSAAGHDGMSPHGTEIYSAPFSGFFSEGSTMGVDDSRPGSPACMHDLPDQLYPSDAPSKLGLVFGTAPVRPRVRVRVPYSPPMGSCVATTVFSTSAFSPLSTPTPTDKKNSSTCSFWAHDNNSKFPERVVSPTLSLT